MSKKKSWEKRLSGGPDELVVDFVESLSYDKRLYKYDIVGSIAHANMLQEQKLLTKAEFSVGLIIFTVALLTYSVTSNPLIYGFAGFRLSGAGLGPFTMLPDLFTCIASAILLYLSRQ